MEILKSFRERILQAVEPDYNLPLNAAFFKKGKKEIIPEDFISIFDRVNSICADFYGAQSLTAVAHSVIPGIGYSKSIPENLDPDSIRDFLKVFGSMSFTKSLEVTVSGENHPFSSVDLKFLTSNPFEVVLFAYSHRAKANNRDTIIRKLVNEIPLRGVKGFYFDSLTEFPMEYANSSQVAH